MTSQLFNTISAQLRGANPDINSIAEANGVKPRTVADIRRAGTWRNWIARKEAKNARAKLGVRVVPLPAAPVEEPTPTVEPIVINISQEDLQQVLALVGKVQKLQEEVAGLKQGLKSVRGLINRMSTWVQRIDESTFKLPWRKKEA
ncbi:hypothetical protein QFZ60_001558 [Arthrobacter sp. B2I5]|uniref:hypothetical protein n=1 Tax=Arthrobacter sp. B2I5 TaxID=3042266 RepID=UPI002784E89C|nr:hypothetical protein [Arthrobacter sp. B2I5]MDQ0825385.1 hypothetical protein [Arthrobacter sp. B2I5]